MPRRSKRAVAALTAVVLAGACAVLLLGRGDGERPSDAERGRALFVRAFTPGQGLGPLFNDRSCAGCHLQPRAGGVGRNGLATVLRIGRLSRAGFDPMTGRGGPVARAHAVSELGVACGRRAGIPAGVNVTSVRNAPALFGSGLIDAIDERAIRAGARDRRDGRDGVSGVSGRPNLVRGADGRERVGRFGWKADTPALEQFVAEAFRNELGVTSPEAPAIAARDAGATGASDAADATDAASDACGETSRAGELDRDDVAAVTKFLAALPAPVPARADPAGARVFQDTGCAACHVMSLPAGPRRVALYSDLLLHDMGELLDDRVDQGSATGREWRTAPLWGLRDRTRYLHDGRARSLEAAILAHGGEARRAQRRFRALPAKQRRALVAFLKGL
jgi:CxxC motif-containing protein (DUF1111 family)